MCIGYFSGDSLYNIITFFGVSHSEVLDGVWYTFDSRSRTEKLSISHPESHVKQQRIAFEFKSISADDFDVCIGAIDGILICIQKQLHMMPKE